MREEVFTLWIISSLRRICDYAIVEKIELAMCKGESGGKDRRSGRGEDIRSIRKYYQ